MKHTPGPWLFQQCGSPGYFAIVTTQGKPVPLIGPTAIHNARLIAAAPDMADLLLAALPYVEEGEEFNKPNCRTLSRDIRALLRVIDPECGV
ncbi:MAG: hypothetical protein RL156_1730 [Bacteroidota bacterium]|jgi:hypothetical protein